MIAFPSSRSLRSAVALSLVLGIAPLALLAAVATALRVPLLAATATAFVSAAMSITVGTSCAPYALLGDWRTGFRLVLAGSVLMALGLCVSRVSHGHVGGEIASGLINSAGVILLGIAAGSLVGKRIIDPGHLPAVALASSAADIWSVYAPEGVTHDFLTTPDYALLRLLAVSAAVPPSPVPSAVFGIGDVIFASLYLAAGSRHALPRTRMILAVMAGLLLAGVAVLATRRALPALPFVGALVVIAQPRTRIIAKRDRFPTAMAGCLVAIALARVLLSR